MKVSSRYSMAQIALHWAIAALFAVNYIVSDGMGKAAFQKAQGLAVESAVPGWHVPMGIALLGLMVLRVVLRLVQGAPAQPEGGNPMQEKVAVAAHGLLYVLMILGPMAGIAAWGFGVQVAGDVHAVVMNLALVLIGLHVVGALYHQFVLKDNLLSRMRPM